MKNRTTYIGLVLALVCLGQVNVASAQDTLKLDFQTAMEMALERNIAYRKSQNSLKTAASTRLEYLGALTPSMSISGNLFERRGRQTIQDPETNQVKFVDAVSQNLNIGFDASITLFSGLSNFNAIRAGEKIVSTQLHAIEIARQETIYNLALQYMQALLSKELYRIAQDNLRNQQENLKRIEGLVDVNARPMVEKYNQQYQVKNLEVLAIQAKNKYDNDRATLAQTMQLDPTQAFEPVVTEITVEEVLTYQPSMQELYESAMANLPGVKILKTTTRQNELLLASAKGKVSPSVSAFYNYGTGYNSTVPFGFSEQMKTVFPAHFYGLSFNIPILNGGSNYAQVQRSKVTLKNSELDQENQKSIVYRNVQQAYNDFVAAKASYQSSISQLEAAEMAYSMQKERYEIGAGTFVDFSLSSNSLVQAQSAKAQAEYTLKFQKVILDYQTGRLTTEGIK